MRANESFEINKMIIELNGNPFIKLSAGDYEIGLDDEEIRLLVPDMPDNLIKEEYLYKSYPKHCVSIKNVLVSLKYVTHFEFSTFIDETGYSTESEQEKWGWVWENKWKKKDMVSWKGPFGNHLDDVYLRYSREIPVMQVSWNDANEYIKWYSCKNGKKVRLPHEEEWEVFAMIVGRDIDAAVNITEIRTETADEYLNAIVSMINKEEVHLPGYIWEWTDNWFKKYPGGSDDKEFGTTYKVLRGGSLMSHPMQRIKEYRFRRCPTARSPFYTFRIVI